MEIAAVMEGFWCACAIWWAAYGVVAMLKVFRTVGDA